MYREWTVGKGCCLAPECAESVEAKFLFNYGHLLYLSRSSTPEINEITAVAEWLKQTGELESLVGSMCFNNE